VLGKCVEAQLERGSPFELDVLLVSHLNQQGFHPRKTPGNWLHHGGDNGLNGSTA
jgi:hypothetical protein